MSLYSRICDYQNLNIAWNRVKKNKPAKGSDQITYDMYDAHIRENLHELNLELLNHTYQVSPVKKIVIFENEKERTVSLYCMKDKVVQSAISEALNSLYEGMFPKTCYAYRLNCSALIAIEDISQKISTGQYQWYIKADISHFFDNIDRGKLHNILSVHIREEDLLHLIMQDVGAPVLDEMGSYATEPKGIHQGSILAPILSNIYLLEMDKGMCQESIEYYRYSDDIIVLANDENEMEKQVIKVTDYIEASALELNKIKTYTGKIDNGFEYLGYQFDSNGKSIPRKAELQLSERLEDLWLMQPTGDAEEKLRKSSEVLEGWEQYFRGERTPGSIYEYATVLYMIMKKNPENRDAYFDMREKYHNINRALLKWLVKYWENKGELKKVLFEYEDFYELTKFDTSRIMPQAPMEEAIPLFKSASVQETQDVDLELMQIYTDCGMYNKAAALSDLAKKLDKQDMMAVHEKDFSGEAESGKRTFFEPDKDTIEQYIKFFVGRDDTYAELHDDGRVQFEQIMAPLTQEIIIRHLKGDITVATYIQRNNSTVKYCVLDIDISKKVLFTINKDKQAIKIYLEKALQITRQYQKAIKSLGLTSYPQKSSHRGFHLWIFFSEWIPTRYVNLLQSMIDSKMQLKDEDITMEFFPNTTHIKSGKMGQLLVLPLVGNNEANGCMFDLDFSEISNCKTYFAGIEQYQLGEIKKVLGSAPEQDGPSTGKAEVSHDISAFGELPDSIRIVLENCNLMRYLCLKSIKTSYLTHFERLTVLYVFGHMGEDGKDFVHKVMSFTINYQYGVTQKFISRLKEKPISCNKLREQYARITSEIGCTCNFVRIKNCYPSPVMHAIKDSEEDGLSGMTLPTSRTLTKENETSLYQNINISQQVKDIAIKILDLKKQKRSIDKNIKKCEKELERIYNEAHYSGSVVKTIFF